MFQVGEGGGGPGAVGGGAGGAAALNGCWQGGVTAGLGAGGYARNATCIYDLKYCQF
jgi:hypothetical protein